MHSRRPVLLEQCRGFGIKRAARVQRGEGWGREEGGYKRIFISWVYFVLKAHLQAGCGRVVWAQKNAPKRHEVGYF